MLGRNYYKVTLNSIMSVLSELDPSFIQSITALHSYEHLSGSGTPTLQLLLEEAILQKTGIEKNFTSLVQSVLKLSTASEYRNLTSTIEDSKTTTSSSDNELELDLLKEDLMCVVCRQMVVGANNQLLECADCHSLYHQDCHNPIVTSREAEGWICANCKEIKKAAKAEKSHRSGSSSSGYKSSSSKSGGSSSKTSSSTSSSKTSSSGSKQSSSHSSTSVIMARNPATPNINIISADKRIQIMKKKAASKIHEKRKPSTR